VPSTRRDPVADPVRPPGSSPVDLHTHTSRSDGVLAPFALVAEAAAAGVRLLAIADHDTLAAPRELLAPGAPPLPAGMALLPAVEINSVARGIPDLPDGELHLLGIGVDPDDQAFEAVLAAQRARRRDRFLAMTERLRATGTPVEAELERTDLDAIQSLGRPTLARALVAAGHATSVPDAFARLVGREAPAYVPRDGIGPLEAIAAVRAAGGLPVLAHFSAAPGRPALVRALVDAGLGGLEVYYRSFDRAAVAAMARLVAELGLVSTGGTDFHGDGERYADAHAALWVPPEAGAAVCRAIGRPDLAAGLVAEQAG
jgi:predicted metal-dependent phosphoesterase TrpH